MLPSEYHQFDDRHWARRPTERQLLVFTMSLTTAMQQTAKKTQKTQKTQKTVNYTE